MPFSRRDAERLRNATSGDRGQSPRRRRLADPGRQRRMASVTAKTPLSADVRCARQCFPSSSPDRGRSRKTRDTELPDLTPKSEDSKLQAVTETRQGPAAIGPRGYDGQDNGFDGPV